MPPELAFAMVDQESGGDPAALSKKGAQGFFQLMPATAKMLGVDPTDPVQNIRGGLTYLRQQLDRHNGDVRLALASYNAGPGAVAKAGGVPDFPETTDYVNRILGRLQQAPGQAPSARPSLGRLQVGQPPPGAENASPALGGEPEPTSSLSSLPRWKPGTPPSPSQFETDTGWTGWGIEKGGDVLNALDPRTREGRRNIAGGVGGAVGVAAAVGTGGWLAPTIPVLGAAAGGLWEDLGEQVVGSAPPSTTGALMAGGQQGAYELLGQAIIWPIKLGGRYLIASKVGRAASEALHQTRVATMSRLTTALDAASEAAGDVKALASQTVKHVGREAAEALRGARGAAKETVRTFEARAAGGAEAAGQPLASLVAKPPSAAVAGRRAARVIAGPATEARDLVGQQVEAAAKEGPDIDITALKAEAQSILDRIAKPQRTFPRVAPEEADVVAGAALPGGTAESVARLEQQAAGAGADAAQARAILTARQAVLSDLEAAQAAAQQETLKHPAMGVIQRILNADDAVPFYDAHLWKSELQNALQGTYDKAVKTQVTSITQRLTTGLRDALRGYAPYDKATAAYAKIVPLYTKEYAAALRKEALTDPESLIRKIDPGKPTAVRMLRDVLVKQSAAVGKGVQGQRAWDLVRSAWTDTAVLKGGIEQLEKNLAKLPKEFTDVFYGDQSGSQILQNLQTIASGYKAAVASGKLGVEAAKTAGEVGVEATRLAGRGRVAEAEQAAAGVRRQAAADIRTARQALRAGRQPTAEELAFYPSSLGAGRTLAPAQVLADIARFIALGPGQIWGGLSGMRLLLKGPYERDLIRWAAYSTPRTQWLVRQLTGPSPTALTLSDIARLTELLQFLGPSPKEGPRQSSEITVRMSGAPSARVGAPPPR